MSEQTFGGIIVGILNTISEYFITFMAGLSVLFFLWGVTKYIARGSSDTERQKGRQFMLWGIIGLFVMFSVWGIVGILGNTFGVETVIPQFGG
jgi:hypothetical protein